MPVEWFALSAGARISMDSGTENMDWMARGAAPDHRVHPGRRRDQRRRHRHQRRRPAVLERRGHDADAHQGHPGDDARQRDGADRQAGARLLRRRLGRGQLRHRRLRPDHGPQRPGPVLGARPRRRLRRPARALRAQPMSPRRDASRAAPPPPTRVDRDVAQLPARRSGQRLHDGRRHLLRRAPTPSRKKPFDIRSRDARAWSTHDHPHPRALGRHGATPRPPSSWTPTSAGYPVRLLGIESRPGPAARVPARRRARRSGRRARCSRGRRRRSRARSTRASGSRPLVVLANLSGLRRLAGVDAASCSSSTAPRSAAPSSTSTARSCSAWSRATTAARSWCSPSAERRHGGARGRGLVRLGDRRRPGRRRWCSPATSTPRTAADPRVRRARSARLAGADDAERAGLRGRARRRCGRPCARRSSARWRPSSTPSTASSGRSRGGLGRRDHPRRRAAPAPHRGPGTPAGGLSGLTGRARLRPAVTAAEGSRD